MKIKISFFLIIACLFFLTPFGVKSQTIPTFPRADDVINSQKQPKPDDEKIAAEYLKNKEYDKAVVLYEKLFDEKGTQFYYTYYLYCLIELQDYKTALKIIRKQIKSNPTQLKYLVDEGFIYSLSGDQARTKKSFDEAFENLIADPNQIRDLANAFNYRGHSDYAIETFVKGQKLMPDYPFNLELAQIYTQLGKYDLMASQYLDLLDIDLSKMSVVQGRLQTVINDDPEGIKNDALRKELLRRVQRYPDRIYFSEMLIWHSVLQKNFGLALTQAKSLDRRLQEDGVRVFDLAGLCITNENYDLAIDAYNYLLTKGRLNPYYLDSRIGLLNARYLKVTNRFDYTQNDLTDLEKEYQKALDEFGENASTVPIMKYMAHLQAFYLDKIENAITLLNKAVEMPGTQPAVTADCKIELGDVLLFSGEVWDATLLYSQVDYDFKNNPLGAVAKFKNAKLSYYIGEFGWAKAQLDVLKAATSKLIANDAMELSLLISDNIDMDSSYVALGFYSKADLMVYRNKTGEALAILDSVQMVALWHPLHDEVLFKKGEIMLKQGKFADADSLFAKVTEMYPQDILADNALMKRAELYQFQYQDIPKAMELYEKIMFDYPGSLFVVEARKRYRELRGDVLN